MKKLVILLLTFFAVAPAQANWLSGLTGWCSDNMQIVAGAGIIAGGLFANKILKAYTKKNGAHYIHVEEAYKKNGLYAEYGFICHPLSETKYEDKATYEIIIDRSRQSLFQHYFASTYNGRVRLDRDDSKDVTYKELKPSVRPFVQGAIIGFGFLTMMFKSQMVKPFVQSAFIGLGLLTMFKNLYSQG